VSVVPSARTAARKLASSGGSRKSSAKSP
jgi:hypothetical protein